MNTLIVNDIICPACKHSIKALDLEFDILETIDTEEYYEIDDSIVPYSNVGCRSSCPNCGEILEGRILISDGVIDDLIDLGIYKEDKPDNTIKCPICMSTLEKTNYIYTCPSCTYERRM